MGSQSQVGVLMGNNDNVIVNGVRHLCFLFQFQMARITSI